MYFEYYSPLTSPVKTVFLKIMLDLLNYFKDKKLLFF